jgi:hypothetical protein
MALVERQPMPVQERDELFLKRMHSMMFRLSDDVSLDRVRVRAADRNGSVTLK